MKKTTRFTLAAFGFLFSIGAGVAYAKDYACLSYCKMQFEDCITQGSKAGCVAMLNACKRDCGA